MKVLIRNTADLLALQTRESPVRARIESSIVVDADVTLPPCVLLDVEAGGELNVESGRILRHRGTLQADPYPVFLGEGLIDLEQASLGIVRPEWWGASADAWRYDATSINSEATDNVGPFRSMLESLSGQNTGHATQGFYYGRGCRVQLLRGGYYFASELLIDRADMFEGSDGSEQGGTEFIWADGSPGLLVRFTELPSGNRRHGAGFFMRDVHARTVRGTVGIVLATATGFRPRGA